MRINNRESFLLTAVWYPFCELLSASFLGLTNDFPPLIKMNLRGVVNSI